MTTTTEASRRAASGHTPRIEPERERLCEDNHSEYVAGEPVLEVLVGLMPHRRGTWAFSEVEYSETGRLCGRLVLRYKRADEGSGEAQKRIVDVLRVLFRAGKLDKRLSLNKLADLIVNELQGSSAPSTGGTLRNRERAMLDAEQAMRRDVDHLADLSGHDAGEPLSIDKALAAIGATTMLNLVMSSIATVKATQERYEFREEMEARGDWEPRERALRAERNGLARKHFGPYIVDWVAEQLGSTKPTAGGAGKIARRVEQRKAVPA
ncbi:MAG: hypothetical protein NXI14_08945 [bacterium]|nr:hypothetical protein [bacterium]